MTSRDFVRELQIIIHVYVLFLLRITIKVQSWFEYI